MFHDFLGRKRPLVDARSLCRGPLVVRSGEAQHAQLFQFRDGLEGVLLGVVKVHPLDLVERLVATNLPADHLLRLASILAPPRRQLLALLRLILAGRLREPLLQGLVVAVLVPLLHVDVGGGVQELFEVEHVVLSDVCHSQVSVLVNLTRRLPAGAVRWLHLAAQEAQQRALPRAIHAHDANAAAEADAAADVPKGVRLALVLVGEVHALQLQNGLPGAVPLQLAGDRETDLRGLVQEPCFQPQTRVFLSSLLRAIG
mmetsp:Transcript_97405/g.275443  ORF Transcript_97405/g.275443 Transcript_97405/m.275443 type:complete len:257 (-) Transcript_97405:3483-4253(-)